MADENDSGELESAERSTIATVKTKRAVVKRRITNTLKKLQGTIEQYGRKSIIRGYVNILEESLNEAQVLNNQLLAKQCDAPCETISHMFYECPAVKSFWEKVIDW